MITPELTYQYSQPKDVSGGTLIIVNKEGRSTDLETLLLVNLFIVPADKVFVLSVATCVGTPGSAPDLCTFLQMSVRFENSVIEFYRGQESPPDTEGTDRYIRDANWSGQLWCPPSSTIAANAGFSGITLSNDLRFNVHGVLIPRGNVQQG